MQYFKGDEKELKMVAAGIDPFDQIGVILDEFYEEAYNTYLLGGVIYDDARSPLSNAINRNIFISSFNEIFASFVVAGSFESYLSVFRRIFGDTVTVEFTVPAPGKLNIDITASELVIDNILGRRIVDGAYVFDELVDENGENIVGASVKGFQTEYELNQMLFEMVPQGIYTEITLSFEE